MNVEQNKDSHLGHHAKPLKAGDRRPEGVGGWGFVHRKQGSQETMGSHLKTAEGGKTANPELYTQREHISK